MTRTSAKEKYDRQRELARERQRRRRARLTEEQLEAKRKYDRDRREKLKKEKKIKTVADMTPREHRKMKKYWRERNKIRSLKKKGIEAAIANTPPASPIPSPTSVSSQKKRGRKIVRKDRAKSYRTINKQKDRIKELERKVEMYRKRLERLKEKSKLPGSPSPRKKVKEVVGREKVSPNVRKQLFLGFVLQKQLKSQKEEGARSCKKSQIVAKVLGNKVIKKYRAQRYFNNLVPYKVNQILASSKNFTYDKRGRKGVICSLRNQLITFFESDCVSRMCPGKKDVVKKNGKKMQRRVLLDPLQVLYEKFKKESDCNISYPSFCRARPFWVTIPKKSDRDTCACIKHSNMNLMINALWQAKAINENSSRAIIKCTVCSSENEECLMSRCVSCKDKTIRFNDMPNDFKIKYYQWKKIKERKVIKGKTKFVQKTIKEKKVDPLSKLKSDFLKMLVLFKKHVFYTKHQAKQLESKINNLKADELAFRIDFSENYVCKYANEIQSVHFGASKRQLSLNTGVAYFLKNGKVESECFASVSDQLDHQAHAVWGHMIPILKKYQSRFPQTRKIHFFSDGPSNQYRNRFNLKLFQTIVPECFPSVVHMTWNFTEAGHGKGPMDGVGGTLKRKADWEVLYGKDITCAKDFVHYLRDTNIFLVEIPPQEIEEMKKKVASIKIPPVDGIMKVHQIVYSQGIMNARSLSCFDCPPSQYCDHFTLFEVFPDEYLEDLGGNCISHKRKKTKKLTVAEVYSDSDEEDSPAIRSQSPPQSPADPMPPSKEKLYSGVFVQVRFTKESRKSETRDFIGVCQGEVKNFDVEIMFLKRCTKDNSLFVVDEKDVAVVHINQIVKIMPPPMLSLKVNRVYYRFNVPKTL